MLPSNLQKRICRRECFTERIGDREKKKQRKRIGIGKQKKEGRHKRKNEKSSSNFEDLKEFLPERREDCMEIQRKELELLENEFNVQQKHMHQDIMIRMMKAK